MEAREDLPTGVVTLVFTDIEGSTRLLHELGDRYVQALTEHRCLVRGAFAAGGGVEVDTQGDAFFVAFPDASRALVAVAEAQRALAGHAWPDGLEVRVRMGVHSGEPLRTDEGYAGLPLHQGARVMGCAHGAQVVVSAATAAAAAQPGALTLRDLGEHRLKDLSEPQRLFQLCGEGLREDFPPLKTLGGYFTNLPTQPSPLLGREHELEKLGELLAAHRLVTLTGPGGTGKTRLALQTGAETLDDFPGGVFFCDLAPLRDPELVAATIAHAIGVQEQSGETSEQAVASYVGAKHLLLVLDNFEQLLEAAPIVARLLGACANLRALVTSRAPLRIYGEREFPVESLPLADAVELFGARASLLGRDVLGPAPVRTTVEAICRRLDGLPLALELAAARLRSLSPEQLLARLEQSLAHLTSGPRDAPDRQRTLRATLDWSHELLTPAEQRLVAALGVFVGGFTFAAAEQVCAAGLDTLEGLVEHSLVRHHDDRYTMLETIREYALDQLGRSGELEAVSRRHADWALLLLEHADPRDGKEFRPASIHVLGATELDNLRQAIPLLIRHRPNEIANRVLAVALTWESAVRLREGIDLVRAISAGQTQPSELVKGRAAMSLAYLGYLVGDLEAALEGAVRGIAAAERAGDEWTLIFALATRAFIAADRDEPAPERWTERALSIARAGRDRLIIGRCLMALGQVTIASNPDQARRSFEEAAELARDGGDRLSEVFAAYNLALVDLHAQRYEEAEALLIRLLRDGPGEPGASWIRTHIMRGLGWALAGRRANHEAARLIGACDAEYERLAMQPDLTEARQRTAALARIAASIGAGATDEALAEGRRMQIGAAFDLALSLFPPEATSGE